MSKGQIYKALVVQTFPGLASGKVQPWASPLAPAPTLLIVHLFMLDVFIERHKCWNHKPLGVLVVVYMVANTA